MVYKNIGKGTQLKVSR